MALLELAGVGKRYGRGRLERVALRDVSFELSAGELVAVWGRRNSGRSTLLRIAAGLEPPDEGVVSLRGRSLNARGGEQLREQIRYCRKTFRPTEGQLVIDRLITAQLTRGIQGPSARTRAHEALERVDASQCATLEAERARHRRDGARRDRPLARAPAKAASDRRAHPRRGRVRTRSHSVAASQPRRRGHLRADERRRDDLPGGADRGLSLAGGELHGELQPPELAPVVQLREAASGQRARERPSDPGRRR